MEYNSFYGGRQGAPFIIVKSFKLVDKPIFSGTPAEQEAQKLIYKELIKRDLEMETLPTDAQMNEWFDEYCMIPNFKNGDDYKTVNYDEYVIIDSVNKNDFDNGKIYQRGRNYLQDDGDAQYIGQIVGPAGVTPHTKMTTIATVQEKAAEAEAATDGRTYRLTSGTYAPTVNLVPGAKGTVNNRTFDETTDSIQYAMVSVRDADGHDAEIYVGFKFPYTIIDFYTTSIKPYQNGRYADVSNIEQVNPKNHPYYEKWHITIPEGVPGDALKNFRVITAANNDGVQPYTNQSDDRANSREILVYDYYDYSDYENGDPKTLYLGSYNMISGIVIGNDGTITVSYTHDNDSVFSKKLNWITNLTLDTNGKFTVTYNNNNISNGTYTANLTYVKNLRVDTDGTIYVTYTDGTASPSETALTNKIKWIKTITLNSSNNGKLIVTYNDNTNSQFTLKWINAVTLADNGTLTFKDSTGATVLTKTLTWITDAIVESNGDFKVKFNNENTYRTLTNIKFINNISGSAGYIDISYNNGDSNTLIWQGTQNSTGALVAEETTPEPEPSFAEGSPWFIIEELPDEEISI